MKALLWWSFAENTISKFPLLNPKVVRLANVVGWLGFLFGSIGFLPIFRTLFLDDNESLLTGLLMLPMRHYLLVCFYLLFAGYSYIVSDI